MPHETAASGTTHAVPQQRTGEPEAEAPAESRDLQSLARPVPFDRILTVATLTPAQASLVAARLLDAAATNAERDGHGTEAVLGDVTLTPSGGVDVAPAPEDAGTPLAELVRDLLRNARRLPVHPKPDQVLLLHRLEDVAPDSSRDPGTRARELEEMLTETLGDEAQEHLTAQLASLVEAFAHVATGVPAGMVPLDAPPRPRPSSAPAPIPSGRGAEPEPAQTGPRRTAPARLPATRPPRRGRPLLRRRTRRRRLAVVTLVVAVLLAVGGYVVVRDGGVGVLGALGAGNGPGAKPTTGPSQTAKQQARQPHAGHVRAVRVVAPRQAGAVTGVAVQKAGRCTLGSLCRVKVTVHLRPSSTARTVTWRVGAARVCTTRIAWSAPAAMTARAGWTTVYAHSSVRLPKRHPRALVALTTAPARAQSLPVPVAGSSLHC